MRPTPSVDDLKAITKYIAHDLVGRFGKRCSVVVLVGLPEQEDGVDTGHDRFASAHAGPCLMTRGLLSWGERSISAEITKSERDK